MRLKDEVAIHIYENGEIVVEDITGGIKSYKQVTADTFVECVKSSIKKYNGDLEIEDFKNKFLLQIYIPIDENMTVGATKVPVVL